MKRFLLLFFLLANSIMYSQIETCSCADGTIGSIINNSICQFPNGTSYCSDPASDNYCNTEGGLIAFVGAAPAVEDCVYGGIEGCTCILAENYNPDATTDNGSCYVEEGCNNPLATNAYLNIVCPGIEIEIGTENCIIEGCTCPEADFGYNPDATTDDGSCISTTPTPNGPCTDPSASNFVDGCDVSFTYIASEDCEYVPVDVNLDWEYTITDGNMTVQVGQESILFNGQEPPCGSLLGGFYTNDGGDLMCAGYGTWCDDFDNGQLAISLWASETGLDNGFAAGEEITWALQIGEDSFLADDVEYGLVGIVPGFTDVFASNGFAQIIEANFSGEVTGTWGCTNPESYNYNPEATINDGSCYNLDWTVNTTDCNMTILIQDADIDNLNISVNGGPIPVGSIIGVFYENELGQLALGGTIPTPEGELGTWTGTSTNVSAMGDDSSTSEIDGFQAGDSLNTWILLIGDQVIPMDENGATMSLQFGPGTDLFACNGFGNLTSVNFEGEYELTYGCTDTTACNYDESAIMDDDSCYFAQTWYQDSDGDGLGNFDIAITSCEQEVVGFVLNSEDPCPNNLNNPNNSQSWYYDEDEDGLGVDGFSLPGCDPPGPDFADNTDDPCPYDPLNIGGCTDETAFNYNNTACYDDDSCIAVIEGCTDETAFNYDENANTDDGSCIAVVFGCIDTTAFNYNENANTDDESCCYIDGCTDETAFNYNENACYDNNSCVPVILGCIDSSAFNYDNYANTDDGSCIPFIFGCMDTTACNYDEDANTDNDTCWYAEQYYDCDGICLVDVDGDGVCDELEIVGCQDAMACNYDNTATDSGDCTYPEQYYDCDGICLVDVDDDDICDELEIIGCQDDIACNYDNTATDSGDCIYPEQYYDCDGICLGDGDGDGVCDELEIEGCTDETACNYDSEATDDNDSCTYENCTGCIDTTACNYSENAVISDPLSCVYPTEWFSDIDGDGLGFDSGIPFPPFYIESCYDYSNEGYADNANDPNEGDFDNDFVFTENDCDDTNVNIGSAEDGYDCDDNCINDEDGDGVCDEFEILGCTNPIGCNYDPLATEEDGCEYFNNSGAISADEISNYTWLMTKDTDCDGTINTTWAINYVAAESGPGLQYWYNINSTEPVVYETYWSMCDNIYMDTNIGTEYETTGELSSNPYIYIGDYNETLNGFSGTAYHWINNELVPINVCWEMFIAIEDCTDELACNYNPDAFEDDGSCLYVDGVCDTCEDGVIIDNDLDNDGVCNDNEIPGCTDPTACNFDASLGCTDDDGSCIYSEITITYEVTAASCIINCDGIIDLEIDNGQPPYNVEYSLDGDDVSIISGSDLASACYGTYNIIITDTYNCQYETSISVGYVDDIDDCGVCAGNSESCVGCLDPLACNFDPLATISSGNCNYPEEYYDCNGSCLNDTDNDEICDELEIEGCTNINACNFDPLATDTCPDEDNSGIPDCCQYPDADYYDCDGNCISDEDEDGVCDEAEIIGCQEIDACNYDEEATEEGDCIYAEDYYDCDGNCVDINQDGQFDDEDGDGICDYLEIEGCTDGTACNFNPDATDPGECYYIGDLSAEVNLESIEYVTCGGAADGEFEIEGVGGVPPYSMSISIVNGSYNNTLYPDGPSPVITTNDDIIFTVSNLIGGSYNVTIYDDNGCEILQTVSIEELAPIEITIEYLNYLSCTGENDAAITASVQGGLPPYEYSWDVDTDGDGINESTQDIDGLASGLYTLTITDASPFACAQVEQFLIGEVNEFSINTNAGQNQGYNFTNVTCFNDNTNGSVDVFVFGGTPPYTYSYTDTDGQTVNPNQLSVGQYIVTINDDSGCVIIDEFEIIYDGDEDVSIEISANPNDLEICEDEEVLITASNNFDFINYQWFHDGVILNENDNEISINESGDYWVEGITSDGCDTISNILSVEVNANPIFMINGPSEVVTGNTYSYYVSDSGNDYEWGIEDESIGTISSNNNENTVEITWSLQGITNIYLTQTDENGCSNTEYFSVDVNWPISLHEFSDEEINFVVYPNPFTDYAIIDVTNPLQINYDLYIYDIKGGLVKSFINQTNNTIRLEKEFSKGIYHIQLVSSNGNQRQLIVVE